MPSHYIENESRIVAMGAAISGFKTARDVVERLRQAGYSWMDIAGADAAAAVMRELRRQRAYGERPAIITTYDPPPISWRNSDWTAVCEGYEPDMPIGRGATEFQAILDLVWQMEGVRRVA